MPTIFSCFLGLILPVVSCIIIYPWRRFINPKSNISEFYPLKSVIRFSFKNIICFIISTEGYFAVKNPNNIVLLRHQIHPLFASNIGSASTQSPKMDHLSISFSLNYERKRKRTRVRGHSGPTLPLFFLIYYSSHN